MAVSAAAGLLIFVFLVRPGRPPGWDEAAHALQGALIAHDIRSGDLLGLLFDTYRQVYWPPLHSWLVAAAFLLAGPSLEAARAVSVVAFVLLAPTLYLVTRTIEPRRGVLAGWLTAGFALTCPAIVALAAASMLEVPALLAFSCAMLAYCSLARSPDSRPERHALLGVCVVVTYLAKTHYGILLVLCIVIAQLVEARFRLRRLLTRENLYAALPLVLFCAIWFAWPPKVATTWNALVNEPYGGEQGQGLAGLLFYPRAIVDLAGPASALLAAGTVAAWGMRAKRGTRFLLILALTQLLIGEIHHTKVDRHVVPMFPPMFVLAGVGGARLWDWLRARGGAGGATGLVLLAGIGVLQLATLGMRDGLPAVRKPSPVEVRHGAEVLDYVSTQVRESAPVLVVDMYRSWPHPPVVDWNLLSLGLLEVTASDEALDPRQERRLAAVVDRARLPEGLRHSALRVLERYDVASRTRTLHFAPRFPGDPDDFAADLGATIRADPPRSIVALVETSDSTHQRIESVAPVILGAGYRVTSVRDFPRGATRIHVYGRPTAAGWR